MLYLLLLKSDNWESMMILASFHTVFCRFSMLSQTSFIVPYYTLSVLHSGTLALKLFCAWNATLTRDTSGWNKGKRRHFVYWFQAVKTCPCAVFIICFFNSYMHVYIYVHKASKKLSSTNGEGKRKTKQQLIKTCRISHLWHSQVNILTVLKHREAKAIAATDVVKGVKAAAKQIMEEIVKLLLVWVDEYYYY